MALKPEVLSKKALVLYRAYDDDTIKANGNRMTVNADINETFYLKIPAAVNGLLQEKVDKKLKDPLKPCQELIGQTLKIMTIVIYTSRISEDEAQNHIEQEGDVVKICLNRGYQKAISISKVVLKGFNAKPNSDDDTKVVFDKIQLGKIDKMTPYGS